MVRHVRVPDGVGVLGRDGMNRRAAPQRATTAATRLPPMTAPGVTSYIRGAFRAAPESRHSIRSSGPRPRNVHPSDIDATLTHPLPHNTVQRAPTWSTDAASRRRPSPCSRSCPCASPAGRGSFFCQAFSFSSWDTRCRARETTTHTRPMFPSRTSPSSHPLRTRKARRPTIAKISPRSFSATSRLC